VRRLAPLLASFALLLAAPLAAVEYKGTSVEQEAVSLLEAGRYVKARETAEVVLAVDPDSFIALYVLGSVYVQSEGSLPRARFFLERGRSVIEKRWGDRVPETGPWEWHNLILRRLIDVFGDMDLREEQLQLLAFRDARFTPEMTAEYGWPLMKLGRNEEARAKMREALESKDPIVRSKALNTLGAIENLLDRPEESYRIFRMLVDDARAGKVPMDEAFVRNAGVTAIGLQKFDEGEKLLLEATRCSDPSSYATSWRDVATLYMGQGRLPEAMQAVRQMQAWGHTCLPSVGQQSWAERQTITAALLDLGGYPADSLALMRSVMNRPDRRGGTSGESDQAEAGTLVFYRHVLAVHRESLAEEMSWCRARDWPGKAIGMMRDSLGMWSAAKRAAALIVRNDRLGGSVRFYSPDSIDIMDWIRPELVDVMGPGVVAAEARRRLANLPPGRERERPYLLLMLGESELRGGHASSAVSILQQVSSTLPRNEVLLHARVHALLARAADVAGDRATAVTHYQWAMEKGPSVMRSLGLSLPVTIHSSGGEAARKAAGMLSSSPRFENSGGGFEIAISEGGGGVSGSLRAPNGTVLCGVRVNAVPEAVETARLFCKELHRRAFAPRIDLAQTDIASLSGSTLTGEQIREQLKDIFVQ